ncbi:MAG: thiamine pyrophosphate-dependent enzyme [Planctomycetaceae bacterium]|nr:thiamine pyrophosphate-dependent enzyme [Planctomycetaceae bacterium]
MPASLGVQMARGGKTVCVTGDGGAGYHLADIETAVRYRLPVVIVILNNNCLAFEYHEQKYRWQGRVIHEANDFTPVNYAAAATALGAQGRRAVNRAEVDAALDAAMRCDGPTVVEVVTDPEAFPPVTNFDAVMERKI